MVLPATVKIGGREYRVDFPYTFIDTQRPLYGLHDPGGQTIKIGQKDEFGVNRHPQSILHTYFHEIIHAIDNVYNGGKLTAWEHGEDTVDQLAEGLLQFLQDNEVEL
jgi:hypothetical protein